MLRVVMDTNIILSKFISTNGTSGQAFDFILRNCTPLMCDETLAELAAKLSEEKFFRYGSDEDRKQLVQDIEARSEFIDVKSEVSASDDPKDNIFLSLALDGRADYIVSGDKKHLLPLHPFEGIPILSPAGFLAAMSA
jgi:putative PIN family toxin of toxin-antitoxin system